MSLKKLIYDVFSGLSVRAGGQGKRCRLETTSHSKCHQSLDLHLHSICLSLSLFSLSNSIYILTSLSPHSPFDFTPFLSFASILSVVVGTYSMCLYLSSVYLLLSTRYLLLLYDGVVVCVLIDWNSSVFVFSLSPTPPPCKLYLPTYLLHTLEYTHSWDHNHSLSLAHPNTQRYLGTGRYTDVLSLSIRVWLEFNFANIFKLRKII